jgi:hypothetical protein
MFCKQENDYMSPQIKPSLMTDKALSIYRHNSIVTSFEVSRSLRRETHVERKKKGNILHSAFV